MNFTSSTIVLLVFGLGPIVYQAKAQSADGDSFFWAAKYSQQTDHSRLQSVMPELPGGINTTIYYIQYGDKSVIEVRHPDDESSYLPVVIVEWDYRNGQFNIKTIYNNVNKYYLVTDSIPFEIEESRHSVRYICDPYEVISQCDSVLITSMASDAQHLVILTDSLPNMKSYKLFYPDIKYLPKLITRHDIRRSPFILDDVIYGKHSIDSLLTTFSHEGYERITDEEMNSFELQIPLETLQELDRTNRAKE